MLELLAKLKAIAQRKIGVIEPRGEQTDASGQTVRTPSKVIIAGGQTTEAEERFVWESLAGLDVEASDAPFPEPEAEPEAEPEPKHKARPKKH